MNIDLKNKIRTTFSVFFKNRFAANQFWSKTRFYCMDWDIQGYVTNIINQWHYKIKYACLMRSSGQYIYTFPIRHTTPWYPTWFIFQNISKALQSEMPFEYYMWSASLGFFGWFPKLLSININDFCVVLCFSFLGAFKIASKQIFFPKHPLTSRATNHIQVCK